MGAMVIDMNETRVCALGQLKAFLEGTGEIRFQSVGDDEGRYSHIQAVLKRFAYPRLKRADKGRVLRYLGRTTGLFTATVDPSGAAVLGHRRACQALPSAGTGLCPKVHGGRCGAFGRDRCPARHALGTGHQAFDAARFVGLLGHPLCAAGVHLGGASLQPAGRRRLPGAPPTLGQDASHRYPDRGAPRAATGRAPRLPAHRQRPPGR
jgi:hypothetical protein